MDNNRKTLSTDNISYKHISIGYLGTKILAPIQIKILSGIKKAAEEHDITLYQFSGPSPDDLKEVISQSSFVYKLICPKKLQGIIGWSSQIYNKSGFVFDIEGFLDRNPDFPAVFIGKPIKDYPTVMIDNYNAIQEMMHHLIHVHNYRKIAFICGPDIHPYAVKRYEAYINSLKSNNIVFNPKLVFKNAKISHKYGIKAICHFLDNQHLKPKIDIEAIVSVSDVLSCSAIEELKKRNISVPGDIAVVGFNNKYESLFSKPAITTVDINFEEMGKNSMELLLSMLNGEKKTGIFHEPTTLVIRESCGCFQGDIKLKKSSEELTIDKDYDSKKESIEKLNRQIEHIKSQINKKTDMAAGLEYKWSEALLTGLMDSIKTESSRFFLHEVEHILDRIAEYRINIFLLNQYILNLREKVIKIFVDEDLKRWVELLFYNAGAMLIRKAEHETVHSRMEMVYSRERTISLYQSIVSTCELSTLLDLLADKLPEFGIAACYFSLFSDPEESIEYATLKLAYNTKGVYKLYENKNLFESAELIPGEYYYKINKLVNVILPLYFEHTPLGFIIIGISKLTEFNGIVYEVLRSLISSSLQRARDLQKLKFTRVQLEKKAEGQRMAVLEAKKANAQKTRFFINLAHETKTPLTLIQNYLSLYMEQHPPDENLQIIKQNMDLLVANILNFMDIEKLQTGNTLYQHDILVNLSASTEKKCALFCEIAKMKKISFICNLEKDVFIKIDPYALDSILNNLLDNAVKYIQEEGKIWITVSKKEGRAILQVKDNGPGLPVDTYEHIFEPYYLLSRNRTGQQGTGVGLSIVKKILDELTASISLEKGSKRGACFTIFFRESHSASPPELLQDIPVTPPAPLIRGKITETDISPGKPSILVVDDNIELLKLIQSTLKETYNIFLARDVKEAFFKIRIIPHPVLIIADIMMEGPDGFTFIRELSELEEYNDIPFIFLTALGGEAAKLQGLDLGAVDYIEKPFSIMELTAKINSIIAIRYRQEEKEINDIHKNINQVFSRIMDDNFKKPSKISFKTLCEKYKINDRENRVFQLLLNGLTHKEIASQLNISKRTVEYHLSKIYRKCNVDSKYDLLKKFLG